MTLSGKRIILGITGSIAAYKAAHLCRLLITQGAEVQVIMTKSATDFITPLSLSVLSKRPVLSEMIGQGSIWNNHIELGLWADLVLVAPCSANTMAAFSHGICENLLQSVFLSARCPVMIAPAMDHDMYLHEATRANLDLLKNRGVTIINPVKGELASGIYGEGRMEEPEMILQAVVDFFSANKPLSGKKVLITTGPTREPIDPVRYITNHSTGKMGLALAKSFFDAGATVTLIAGPIQLAIPGRIETHFVETADEMYKACLKHFPESDITIMTAAVADYRPADISENKIKKSDQKLQLKLEATTDILSALGKLKKESQFLVGFALETDDELKNAQSKLERKNLDMIVLNSLRDEGAGFGTDTNKVTLIFRNNQITEFPLMSKQDVANRIVDSLVPLINV